MVHHIGLTKKEAVAELRIAVNRFRALAEKAKDCPGAVEPPDDADFWAFLIDAIGTMVEKNNERLRHDLLSSSES